MDRNRARTLITAFDFANLFADELMWNRQRGSVLIEIDGVAFELQVLAEKKQVQVLRCPPLADGALPPYPLRQKIERQVTKQAREHLIIFADAAQRAQVWQWVSRQPGHPTSYREIVWQRGQSGDLLLEKLGLIAFRLEDDDTLLTVLDVAGKLRDAFDRDKLTKRFYGEFKLERDAFLGFIKGLLGQDAAWYTSVMINRLMFVYFLQRKRLANNEGFLDNRHDYLRYHLQETQRQLGRNRFYRDFLCPLFFQGFAQSDRRDEVTARFGDIPFLNGGLFNRHPLETEHGSQIQIADAAFEKLFDYFDAWDWHLDERPLQRSESALKSAHLKGEINPEVLGYIFEKYINQKQLGAYYTKEDITGYICRNTILPGLLDKVRARAATAFEADAWPLLVQDADRYIWPAMRQGADQPLPAEIEAGMDPDQPDLLEKRKPWNRRAPETHALPTEIWREVVSRRQRYQEVKAKLTAGEVRELNDLITYNLDIAQFAQDVVERSEDPALVRAVWRALVGVVPDVGSSQREFEYGFSVLDPTCGSGAFLFAALNILEPLYRACLTRMRAFALQADLEGARQRYPDFRKILEDVDRRPNEGYFICKSIIINNLYGVDIVEEAVEIAKLRLFLKLVAQLEDKRHIEPLPDIDFNVRAGNALVGFATYDEVRKAVKQETTGQQKILLDDAMTLIEQEAHVAERAYLRFRQQQVALGGEITAEDKQALRGQLTALEDRLNWYLAREYGIDPHRTDKVEKWKASHKPFHWFVDFYGIVKQGGFDAIVGNPPWVEYSKVQKEYVIVGYSTLECGNLYALCTERCLTLRSALGSLSFIVQLPFVSSERMALLRNLVRARSELVVAIPFDDRPGKLFEGLQHCRSSILFARGESHGSPLRMVVSRYQRWTAGTRHLLFPKLVLVEVPRPLSGISEFPKLESNHLANTLAKLLQYRERLLARLRQPRSSKHIVFYQESAQYWVKASSRLPYYARNGIKSAPAHGRFLYLESASSAASVSAVLNSSLFYCWFVTLGDCFHVSDRLVASFPAPDSELRDMDLSRLNDELLHVLKKNAVRKSITLSRSGELIEYDEYSNSAASLSWTRLMLH